MGARQTRRVITGERKVYVKSKIIVDREQLFRRLHDEEGWPYHKVGKFFGLSTGRVQQLCYRDAVREAWWRDHPAAKEVKTMKGEEAKKQSVDVLELSVRTANVLRHSGIMTVGDLIKLTAHELLEAKNFGRKSLDELRGVLQEMELTLAGETESDEEIKRMRVVQSRWRDRTELQRDVLALRKELRVLRRCCTEALSGQWDRGDEGFKAMIEGIDMVLYDTRP